MLIQQVACYAIESCPDPGECDAIRARAVHDYITLGITSVVNERKLSWNTVPKFTSLLSYFV